VWLRGDLVSFPTVCVWVCEVWSGKVVTVVQPRLQHVNECLGFPTNHLTSSGELSHGRMCRDMYHRRRRAENMDLHVAK
jgi:hypothetical protein